MVYKSYYSLYLTPYYKIIYAIAGDSGKPFVGNYNGLNEQCFSTAHNYYGVASAINPNLSANYGTSTEFCKALVEYYGVFK